MRPGARVASRYSSLSSVIGRLRTLVFLLAAVPVGAVALAVLIAGWVVVPVVAITPLVIPALVGLPER